MKLYPDQEIAASVFEEWLNNSTGTLAGLWASAGFGKSYMAKHLILNVILKESNWIPIITSLTHSAVEVLSEFTGMEVTTLHSLMGWVPMRDKDTGEEYTSTPYMRDKNAECRLAPNQIIVIDEAGLLGHDELALLLVEIEKVGARVLFIGDHKQCYPVMRKDQKLCVPAYEATECFLELTVPKRVDDKDMIYKLSTAYRNAVDGARQPILKTALNPDESGKGVRHVDDIEELAYLAFKAGVRDGNTRNIKVLAFTNDRCLTLNKKIRKKVMGLKDPTPVVGEEMISNTSIESSSGDGVLIKNNQLLTVVEVEKTESFGMAGAFVQFADRKGENIEEVVFVPSSPSALRDRLKEMSHEAKQLAENGHTVEAQSKWRAFFSLKDAVADIRYTYAITVNKAQGVTLKHALVDMCDINMCFDREQKTRMAYTAVTRATDYVTIEGELT